MEPAIHLTTLKLNNFSFCDCFLIIAGPENPWLVQAYLSAAKHPFASIVAQEVFQAGVIPADTDFRIYRDFGNIPGTLNYFIRIIIIRITNALFIRITNAVVPRKIRRTESKRTRVKAERYEGLDLWVLWDLLWHELTKEPSFVP